MRSRLLQHCRPTRMSLARWALFSVNVATCSEESCLATCEDARAALHHIFTCTHVQLSSCYLLPSVWLALSTAECAVQYRAWQQSGHFFIQMDLAEHGSLGHLLRQVCLRPSSMTRATEASATRCQLCSLMTSSRNGCSCCLCMPFIGMRMCRYRRRACCFQTPSCGRFCGRSLR